MNAYWKALRKWKLNRAFKGVYMMYALFFVKSLNGLNKVLSDFKTKKPSKIKGLSGVFWQGLKVLTIFEYIYICIIDLRTFKPKNCYALYVYYFILRL